MRKFLRHLKNYLKERQEERLYQALLNKERGEWRMIESYQAACSTTYTNMSPSKTIYKGDILVVCEENNLGERRFRTLNCPDGFSIDQLENYTDILLWVNQAEITLPPKPDRLYDSFADLVLKLFP